MMRQGVVQALALAAGLIAGGSAVAQQPFADVGRQPPITILINSSPWYAGFEHVVQLYEKQTGNKVNLDVTPFGGMLEKARNAVRSGTSPYDIVNLDTQWTIEFYAGGFLTPLKEIDPRFDLPAEVMTYNDSGYWNEAKKWRTRDGGTLMSYSPNGNVHLFMYRADLFQAAGLKAPETWDDVSGACTKLQQPGRVYGFAIRGERGNAIRYDWMPFMLGKGATVARDPQNGDFTVVVNSPQAKQALDIFIDLLKRCGPPNHGALGQADVIQLLATGRAAQGMVVVAAWSSFDDPTKSTVVGKINAAVVPRPADGTHGVVIGNWHFGVPKNVPAERKQAAMAFSKWFLTAGAQRAYLEGGGIPVRRDIFTAELASNPKYRWLKPYVDSQSYAKQELGYAEGPQVEQILGLRLNQALIGEMSPGRALNTAAREIEELFRRNGRRTGMLAALPE